MRKSNGLTRSRSSLGWESVLASLSLPLYASIGRIPGPEQSRLYKLGELVAWVSAGASVAGHSPSAWRSPGNWTFFRSRSHASSKSTALLKRLKSPETAVDTATRFKGVNTMAVELTPSSEEPSSPRWSMLGVIGAHSLLGSVWRPRFLPGFLSALVTPAFR